jgi:deoxyadenosine/deoxycytidine kinase
MNPSRHIVIEGPIGVGKTSLARRLAASFSSDLLLEQAEENPFLPRFYSHPRETALPTQLFFLFQRVRQLEKMRQADMFAPVRVADFLLEKDRLFAQLNLDTHELDLYEQVWANLQPDLVVPDLVVYLQAPADVLLERIARRGIGYEQSVSRRYLERLLQAYAAFFHDYDAAPLLIVNTANIDPISNELDYAQLFEAIQRIRHGRHFFNPVANLGT